jgi:hypothetical protein
LDVELDAFPKGPEALDFPAVLAVAAFAAVLAFCS